MTRMDASASVAGTAATSSAVTSSAAPSSATGRVPFAVAAIPVGVGAALAWHPADPALAMDLQGLVGRWLTIHLVLLIGLPLLALIVQRMLRNVPGGVARAASALVVPGAALYVAFEVLVGLGTGVLVAATDGLPASAQPGAAALTQVWWEVPGVVSAIASLAIVTWTLAVALAGVALVRRTSRPLAGWLLTVSAVLFAAGHPGVTGAVSMAAFAAAVIAWDARRTDPS